MFRIPLKVGRQTLSHASSGSDVRPSTTGLGASDTPRASRRGRTSSRIRPADAEVREALEQARSAFPAFTAWEFTNEVDEDDFGFSLWGDDVPDPEDIMPRRFFVTLETYGEEWRGYLTIGQHAYQCRLWGRLSRRDRTLPLAARGHPVAEDRNRQALQRLLGLMRPRRDSPQRSQSVER